MSRLLFLNNKIPTKFDLLSDDLVREMVDEAKAEGAKGAPTKESVIQSLTIEDIPKLPETVRQKIVEDAKSRVKKSLLRQMHEAKI